MTAFRSITIIISLCGALNSHLRADALTDQRLGPSLVPKWAQTATKAPSTENYYSLSTDATGDAYVAGYIAGKGSFQFGDDVLISGSSSANSAVLLKYNSAGILQWARSTSKGSKWSRFEDVSTDGDGNLYAVGVAAGNEEYGFGNGKTLRGVSQESNPIVVKYKQDGSAEWAHTSLRGKAGGDFTGVTTDNLGGIYAVGLVRGEGRISFSDSVGAVDASAQGAAIIIKYNRDGVLQWVHTASSGTAMSQCLFRKVRCDRAGNLYIVGELKSSGTYSFGNGVTALAESNRGTAVLVKYASSGKAMWARTAKAANAESYSLFINLAIDANGNINVVGALGGHGVYEFGENKNVEVNQPGTSAISVIAQYDPAGITRWVQVASGKHAMGGVFAGIAIDKVGNILATGFILGQGDYEFGNGITVRGPYHQTEGVNAVLIGFSSSGVARMSWVANEAFSNHYIQSVTTNPDGRIYAVGTVEGTKSLRLADEVSVTGAFTGQNAFIAQFTVQ